MKHKGSSRFWVFRNAADDPKVGELLLYGSIANRSWWGDEVTPRQFAEDLKALGDIDELKVFINSGGGDVFAGQAIYSQLKRHKARVTVYVDGLAASIASVIAMAGDTVRMPANAMMMIHNPSSWGWGTADEFRKLADYLDKVRESLIATYEAKSGQSREKIIELMDAETWMTADEAVELGFADEVEEAKEVAASVSDGFLVINGQQFDLAAYRNPPRLAFLPHVNRTPASQAPEEAPEPDPQPHQAQTERRRAPLSLFERRVKINERG